MTGFFAMLWSQFGGWIGAGAVSLIAMAAVFLSGKSAGRKDEALKQAEARAKLEDQYDEIDGQPIDPGTSYGNLRERLHDDKDKR